MNTNRNGNHRNAGAGVEEARPARRLQSRCAVEPLEGRTLLSAAWSTVDTYTTDGHNVTGMAADKAGNVYMSVHHVSLYNDGSGPDMTFVREKLSGSTSWTTIFSTLDYPGTTSAVLIPEHHELAVDAAGDVFLGGNTLDAAGVQHWVVREQPAGAPAGSFSVIDDIPKATCVSLCADGLGNIYATGSANTTYQIVRKFVPGVSGFTAATVYQTAGASNYSGWNLYLSVAAIDSGAGAGVYFLTIDTSGHWIVLKSANGGQSWSQVDKFKYDPTISNSDQPTALAGDASGNVYVAGIARSRSSLGATPHWLVRKSANGGASWSTNDDTIGANAFAAGTDLAGHVYIAGNVGGSPNHGVVRTNAGGSWANSDNYPSGTVLAYDAFATDSSGNLYAAGHEGKPTTGDAFIRSMPAAPTNLSAAPDAIFPSTQINLSWTNAAGSDETGFSIFRSTDGINFTLLSSVDASTTAYSDKGLSPGTKYYYYVIALLNLTGASAASNTAIAATST